MILRNSLRVTAAADAAHLTTPSGLRRMFEADGLTVDASSDVRELSRSGRERAYVVGRILGRRDGDRLTALAPDLRELWHCIDQRDTTPMEGEFIVVHVTPNGECWIAADAYGRRDVYCRTSGAVTAVATSLDLLPVDGSNREDPVALAHALCIYGCRPAKEQTLSQEDRRLGLGETWTIRGATCQSTRAEFDPHPPDPYGPADLDRYADLLLDAIQARATDANVVYLSSGWDSTSILACLVQLKGPNHVRCVIGRMIYSERRGVVNQFEIDRARAVADFFGVPLEVIDFDYRTNCEPLLARAAALFRPHDLSSITGLNHLVLAEHVARTCRGSETVFAGEISDGAHNLGFSQSATIFHPVLEFREYADKMASYLFGPSFLRSLEHGRYDRDPVFLFLRDRFAGDFDDPAPSGARRRQLLSSFFLRSRRIPLWSLRNSRLLSPAGRERYAQEMEDRYLAEPAERLTPETLYAWYLHLYNAFHWQGSTVATLPLTVEHVGLQPALPFWDSRLQDFLGGMPENWGRGLDLNPTKYPLKWTLQHRVRYPMHLQVGPHSYLYDVDPTFSHSAELLYASGLRPLFSRAIGSGTLARLEEASMFDLDYARGLIDEYAAGTEARGSRMGDLLSLCLVEAVGTWNRVSAPGTA
jgi:hypothetical protein